MFNRFIADNRSVFTPLLTNVDQCIASGVFTISANGNSIDGITVVSIEKETSIGSGVFAQTYAAQLTANPQTFTGGVFDALKYRARVIRNGLYSAYSAIFDLTGTTVSVACAPPTNVVFVPGAIPQLSWDDSNFTGFTIAYDITDNLGGHFTGNVIGNTPGHLNNLTPGATSATIFETFRCFVSPSVTKP